MSRLRAALLRPGAKVEVVAPGVNEAVSSFEDPTAWDDERPAVAKVRVGVLGENRSSRCSDTPKLDLQRLWEGNRLPQQRGNRRPADGRLDRHVVPNSVLREALEDLTEGVFRQVRP